MNLTVASFCTGNDWMQPQDLLVWNEKLSQKISQQKDILLSKYLPFKDSEYISPALDKIRLQANREINEYGFNQLRLVASFLTWYDVKNYSDEKMVSPLVLIPITLIKKKGVQDDFVLRFTEDEAEINPVLAAKLKDLYNIILPEFIDFSETTMSDLYQMIKSQIEATSDVQLVFKSQPDLNEISIEAERLLYQYNTKKNQASFNILQNDVIEEEPIHIDKNTWEFDICNIALGNFSYRKMSLIRDYDTLIEQPLNHDVFNQLFSDLPRQIPPNFLECSESLSSQFHVVQSDPTQNAAVAIASRNESYIIQGPPGTGKSQTIANLIADFVARGKKVLFVCEKRAAIDVVYFRLQQKKLDEFCSLIHDSQSDKKAFIMGLKKTSENYQNHVLKTSEIEYRRNQIIYQIDREFFSIRLFHSFMRQRLEKANIDVRQLLDIVISNQHYISGFDVSRATIPAYDQWAKYGSVIKKLTLVTKAHSDVSFFSKHPFSYINESLYYLYDRSNNFQKNISQASVLLEIISKKLNILELPAGIKNSLHQIAQTLHEISTLAPFKKADKLDLLHEKSELSLQFTNAIHHLKKLEENIVKLSTENAFWINKFSAVDVENALEIVEKYEDSFFSFLSGKYRRTKKTISKNYDFNKHHIKPSYKQILKKLQEEYHTDSDLKQQKIHYENIFKLGELYELESSLQSLYHKVQQPSFQIVEHADSHVLYQLQELHQSFESFHRYLAAQVYFPNDATISDASSILQAIIDKINDLPLFLPYLKEISTAEKLLKDMVFQSSYSLEEMEALLAKSSLQRMLDLNPEILRITGNSIQIHVEKISQLYNKFLHVNALYIRSKQREIYLDLINKSELSLAGKSEFEKEEKRLLVEGRKILNNEFGKSMRYKSIRDLSALESGRIIRELKPVWLMSPLSVSETLPLQSDYFDVVIFDEASQITLEDGVPSIYRASKTIIVGDEMQMPPSNFFDRKNEDPEENNTEIDADSFLTQGARRFPSVMLGWHYRSRHESLIAFSNAAFYGNRLLTIPDNIDQSKQLQPIVSISKNDAVSNIKMAEDRPISYHYLQHGIYENRTNISEAEYIAELVREILKSKSGMSIGVVAFSKEQQGEIEDAVERLCAVDKDFDNNLDHEYKRIEQGQFAGIFFKNLENIQGDERDIIIMSTCYGYNRNGKMIMNFGPINRHGGEKRLNVIFSRAKRRMFVISSIHHSDITNEYNTGSNYFKKYLQYAECMSLGNIKDANSVLQKVVHNSPESELKASESDVLYQLQIELEKHGYIVEANIGQSHFKCHLGIKKLAQEEYYTAGILLDDEQHYIGDNVMEQYVFKPQLLENNGWNIIRVFSKDWLQDKQTVLKIVLHAIENKTTVEKISDEQVREELKSLIFVEPMIQNFFRLEIVENEVRRFWEICVEGTHIIIQHGKITAKPTKTIKPFEQRQMAEKEMDRLIRLKIKKGYTKFES